MAFVLTDDDVVAAGIDPFDAPEVVTAKLARYCERRGIILQESDLKSLAPTRRPPPPKPVEE